MSLPKVVMASGVFDLLHRGHINLLWQARELGDLLVIGIVSDGGTMAYKGRMPVQAWSVRAHAVAQLGLGLVEYQPGTDPTPLLERFRPDILVHGDDWATLKEGQATVERLGIEWRLVPYTPGISTTQLRAEVAA